MEKIIAICGKICSGKSWYAGRLKEKEKAVTLSCDEVTYLLFDNNLGEQHDMMSERIQRYLKKKAAELARADCRVILDWGFWRLADRKALTDFCRRQGIRCEWHYICVDDQTWHRNIEERNRRILSGQSSGDYYLDEGLMRKLLSLWEEPSADEIDVWYTLKRE